MSLWKVFMQDLRFLDFYMSNDTNSKLKLWKLAKFWAVRILVARTVRHCPRTVRQMHRQASVTLMVCPLSKRGRSAKERGQSAHAVFRWSQAAKLIMSYKGISLVDHIHLGAYEMLELDIYALIACYKMFEWIKCL
jgi:hypothetical protein